MIFHIYLLKLKVIKEKYLIFYNNIYVIIKTYFIKYLLFILIEKLKLKMIKSNII